MVSKSRFISNTSGRLKESHPCALGYDVKGGVICTWHYASFKVGMRKETLHNVYVYEKSHNLLLYGRARYCKIPKLNSSFYLFPSSDDLADDVFQHFFKVHHVKPIITKPVPHIRAAHFSMPSPQHTSSGLLMHRDDDSLKKYFIK